MEKTIRLVILFLALLAALGLSGCGGGGSSAPPPTGALNITIVDGMTANPLEGARVILLDAESEPLQTYVTEPNGIVSKTELFIGDYQLKISAQGYNSSPPPRVPPLPVKIYTNQTTDVTIELFPIDPTLSVGAISGKIISGNSPVVGALVIADGVQDSYTTISDADGNYVLYNVEKGSAYITAYIKDLNFPILNVEVIADTTTEKDLVASDVANGTISGSVQFVAGGTTQPTTDITLIDLVTREVIPGMRVYTDANDNYTMSGLPNGSFEIIASMLNDGNVIDPDEAVIQGDPLLTVINGTVDPSTRDFKITGAVVMDEPATPDNNEEVPVLTATPTFTWHYDSSYSNASGFTIEVINENGETVWGGFGDLGPVKDKPINPPIEKVPGGTYKIDYAGPALQSGRYYQLRIYAMKDANDAILYPNGYKLVSVTENLDGVFKVE